jgi:hypothetical protein
MPPTSKSAVTTRQRKSGSPVGRDGPAAPVCAGLTTPRPSVAAFGPVSRSGQKGALDPVSISGIDQSLIGAGPRCWSYQSAMLRSRRRHSMGSKRVARRAVSAVPPVTRRTTCKDADRIASPSSLAGDHFARTTSSVNCSCRVPVRRQEQFREFTGSEIAASGRSPGCADPCYYKVDALSSMAG